MNTLEESASRIEGPEEPGRRRVLALAAALATAPLRTRAR
jgi:hypothetical protein